MSYKYSYKTEKPCARAFGVALPVSRKYSIEIANFIRGKNVEKAKKMLEEVIQLKHPVPLKIFTDDTGHKKGMMAGRYPVNASTEILKLIKSAESNAAFIGLSKSDLMIQHISVNKGPTVMRHGRFGGRRAKRTHIEIILTERKKKEAKK